VRRAVLEHRADRRGSVRPVRRRRAAVRQRAELARRRHGGEPAAVRRGAAAGTSATGCIQAVNRALGRTAYGRPPAGWRPVLLHRHRLVGLLALMVAAARARGAQHGADDDRDRVHDLGIFKHSGCGPPGAHHGGVLDRRPRHAGRGERGTAAVALNTATIRAMPEPRTLACRPASPGIPRPGSRCCRCGDRDRGGRALLPASWAARARPACAAHRMNAAYRISDVLRDVAGAWRRRTSPAA